MLGRAKNWICQAVTETIEMKLETVTQPLPVRVDLPQLEAALLNLVVNARDAMQGTGSVHIKSFVAHAPLDTPASLHSGEWAAVSVSDTGPGIPDEIISKVFEPFFTTKAPGKGTGLGLSQVHGFMRQSGGDIEIKTQPSEGTGAGELQDRDGDHEAGRRADRAIEDNRSPHGPEGRARVGEAISRKTLLRTERPREGLDARPSLTAPGQPIARSAAGAVALATADMAVRSKQKGPRLDGPLGAEAHRHRDEEQRAPPPCIVRFVLACKYCVYRTRGRRMELSRREFIAASAGASMSIG